MADKKQKKSPMTIWIISAVIAIIILFVGAIAIKKLISVDESKRKRQIQMIQIVKPPPPPPKIEEKPPEPEVEEIKEPEPEETPPEDISDDSDDAPAGDDLGLDADGSAGSDSFGLKAKKGGRSLIGGGLGKSSLLRKYAWYTQIAQDEIRKSVQKNLDENGGIPKGKLEAIIRIVLDDEGNIIDYGIIGSSGNNQMDKAVMTALEKTAISEPPPDGMPRAMKLKVTSQG